MRFALLFTVVVAAVACSNHDTLLKGTRKLYFEGNSLMEYGPFPTYGKDQYYIPRMVCILVDAADRFAEEIFLPVSGQNQVQINHKIAANLKALDSGDVVILWEGTNDLHTNSASAEQAFKNITDYVDKVHSLGGRVMVSTVIARDYYKDKPDMMDRIHKLNELLRQNKQHFDALCDLAADEHFNDKEDSHNTEYYNKDRIHQAKAGQDLVAKLMASELERIVSN